MSAVTESWTLGPLAIVAMVVVWVGVQMAWSKVFRRVGGDPDALADRLGCHGCGCSGSDACERRRSHE
jgi:hypothetical protein